jgi:DNA modification methylase
MLGNSDKYYLHIGNAIDVLKSMPDQSVNCCVTSPPYWGLRDYGVDGQLGLEKTPEEYVAKIVEVFREVRRVIRDDGTLWLNLGDTYATGAGLYGNPGSNVTRADHRNNGIGKNSFTKDYPTHQPNRMPIPGLKPKDIVGIPWRVAFALQADGWYLRQDIIWHKPNPMPESVRDRCTKAHEYIFLLSKSQRYYYDYEAIKEPVTGNAHSRGDGVNPKAKIPSGLETGIGRSHRSLAGRFRPKQNESFSKAITDTVTDRNKRSVWTVATKPFKGAHFATFPPDLIEPCILAGCPEYGVVLDPFAGAVTTGVVALKHFRKFIGIELKPEYANEIAIPRIESELKRHKQTKLFN